MGKSIIAQPALAANFYFWRESGYFETAAEYQPLLQTWSLAVEEQFYLFFPLVMILLFKLGRKAAVIGVAGLIAVSLGWSIFSTKAFPSLSFYLLPSRIWELDLGVVLALIQIRRERPRWVNELVSWGGIAMILAAVFRFDLNTPFPGYTALLPCLGAAFVIFGTAQQATTASALLGWTPIRFVGLISYSLYLWHWPLIVFARYLSLGELTTPIKAIIFVLSLILAALSWRFVERPFRKAKEREAKGAIRRVLMIGAAVSALTLSLGLALSKSEGFPNRFSAETLALGEVESPFTGMRSRDYLAENGTLPAIGSPKEEATRPPVLIWGDSHAMSLLTAFDDLGRKYESTVYVAAHPSTPPLTGTWTPRIGRGALRWGDDVLDQLETLEIKTVFITGRWGLYIEPTADGDRRNLIANESGSAEAPEIFEEALQETLLRLDEMGVKVWFMDDVPLQSHSVPETVMLASIRGKGLNVAAKSREDFWVETHVTRTLLERVLSGSSALRLDPIPLLADQDGFLPMARDGKPLCSDEHHLSPFGAEQLKPLFEPIFESTHRP